HESIKILKRKRTVIACGGGARPTEWVEMYIKLMSERLNNNQV
ncbi:unnamed protein product, partial [marine sediment metagenome]